MSEENLKTTYNMFYKKFSGDNIHNERIKQSITNGLLGLALLMDVFTDLGLNFKMPPNKYYKYLTTDVTPY